MNRRESFQVDSILSKFNDSIKKRCEQFTSSVIKSTKPHNFTSSVRFIKNTLFKFAQSFFKQYLDQKIAQFFQTSSPTKGQQMKETQQSEQKIQISIEKNIGFVAKEQAQQSLILMPINELGVQNYCVEQEIDKKQNNQSKNFVDKICGKISESQQYLECIECIKIYLKKEQGMISKAFEQILILDWMEPFQQIIGNMILFQKQQMIAGSNEDFIDEQLRKKQKKVKVQTIQIVDEQSQLKRRIVDYCKQIFQLKQKYSEIRRLLFEDQFLYFWLFKLTEQQVNNRISKYNSYELDDLQKQIFKWGLELQKRTWKIEQKCYIHRRKIFYMCLSEVMKDKIYLCNKCIQDKEKICMHQNHQIVCKLHKSGIKFILSNKQGSLVSVQEKQEGQIFKCQKCVFDPHNKYAFICCYHNQVITQFCIQPECVQKNQFLLCLTCQKSNKKHNQHGKLNFDRQSLIGTFRLNNIVDISIFEQQLIKAKGLLELKPLQKIRISYTQQILPTIKFLDSFAIYNNNKVEQSINCFLSKGRKEDLMVLKGMLQMKQKNYNQIDKLNYLQSFNYLIQRQIQETLKYVWGRLSYCHKKINMLINISEEYVAEQLNLKYKQIMEIQSLDNLFVSPTKLKNVNPTHYCRIEKIKIKKGREEQIDQQIRKKWREAKGLFFREQIKRKLCEGQVGANQSEQIIKLFIEAKYDYKNQLKINSNHLLENLKKHQIIIEILKQNYKQINQYFLAKLKECWPWVQIAENKFKNLKFLHIEYYPRFIFISKFQWYQEKCQYSISAFQFFKFINDNLQLKQVIIKGVQLENIQQFIKALCSKDKTKQRKNRILNQLWIQSFLPRKNLILTLDMKYQLLPFKYYNRSTHSQILLSRVSDLLYFSKQFKQINDVTVNIRYQSSYWGKVLQQLLSCLRKFKKIKIIIGCNHLLIKQLLKGFENFTQITSLAFYDIYFSLKANRTDFLAMQQSLNFIFNNNIITNFTLNWFIDIPLFPKITTLQSVKFNRVSFREDFDLNQFINGNKQLRSVYIQQIKKYHCKIEDKLLNQLQHLTIRQFQHISFGILSVLPSKIKYLCIDNSIDISTLRLLFLKLVNLTQLGLCSLNFGFQLLSIIPSNQLQELVIYWNSQVINQDLELIDLKWPYLKYIQLYNCCKITERFLSLCQFKGLMKIGISTILFSRQAKKYLKNRGIQVK